MDVKFIRPLNDFAFKVLWLNGNQKTKKYLRRIIDNITNLDLSLFANDNQELGGNNYASIASRTDLLLTSKDKKIKLNIEVNNTYTTTIYNKNKTYILKIGGNFYNDLNEKYIDDIKVIQVNLNNFIYKEQNIKKTSFYFYDPINKIEDKSLEILK